MQRPPAGGLCIFAISGTTIIPAMITPAITYALNHLLRQQSWAAQRLAPHAGCTIEINAPAVPALRVRVADDGTLLPASDTDATQLKITLSPDALPRLLQRDERLMQAVTIEGAAGIAADVQHVFRNLEWDFEHDLSKIVGDIAARRLAEFARGTIAWQRDAGARFAHNLAEYWTEERPLIAVRSDVEAFCRDVDRAAEDLERLAKRIESLS